MKEYKKLNPKVKTTLRKQMPQLIRRCAKLNINAATNLKKMLDEVYGSDSYIFVSVGRSPSLIAKAIEQMGVETVYMPLSGFSFPYLTKLDFEELAKGFNKYFKSVGITKENLEKRGKTAIFYDYTSRGLTLKNLSKIIEEYIRIPKDMVDFRSINSDLKIYKSKYKLLIEDMRTQLNDEISSIPYLKFTKIAQARKKMKSFKYPMLAKKFNLELFGQMEKLRGN